MPLTDQQIEEMLKRLDALMGEQESRHASLLQQLHPAQRISASNLLHYLGLRSQDTSGVQNALHQKGLSTLAYSESYIRSQLRNVLQYFDPRASRDVACSFAVSQSLTSKRAAHLFGERDNTELPSIMVTFKPSFAHDFISVQKLLKAGMNIARINCAHDEEKTWMDMIRTIRGSSAFTGIPCRICMDLAGPKLRTRIGKKGRVLLEEEDLFLLTDQVNGKDDLPRVGCTIPGIAGQLQPGERVLFDDGLIEARVVGKRLQAAEMEVVRVSSKKPFLKTEKGINFPDSHISLSALTDFDRRCIPFILEHADLIGYSFVHNTPDLVALQQQMQDRKLPVIVKVETPEAFRNLPRLLFTAMREEYFGVMIARGDLAVEMGFEQMEDIQDQIITLCRAAHAPVIFATQVLENMNKTGLPTRAEITDAAEGIRADCVMLNKGPHTVQAIKTLKAILKRKSLHFFKYHPVYRPLGIAEEFFSNSSPLPV